jgi:hypothetical protein
MRTERQEIMPNGNTRRCEITKAYQISAEFPMHLR